MTSLIFAVIMATSPSGEAQDANLIAAKPVVTTTEQVAEPKINEPERAIRNFHRLLKKGKLTLPGIVIEDFCEETK
jgi:hypothetical protein